MDVRRATVEVSTRLLVDLLFKGADAYEIVEPKLRDVCIIDARMNCFGNPDRIELVVESPDLPRVREGDRLPTICPTMEVRT